MGICASLKNRLNHAELAKHERCWDRGCTFGGEGDCRDGRPPAGLEAKGLEPLEVAMGPFPVIRVQYVLEEEGHVHGHVAHHRARELLVRGDVGSAGNEVTRGRLFPPDEGARPNEEDALVDGHRDGGGAGLPVTAAELGDERGVAFGVKAPTVVAAVGSSARGGPTSAKKRYPCGKGGVKGGGRGGKHKPRGQNGGRMGVTKEGGKRMCG